MFFSTFALHKLIEEKNWTGVVDRCNFHPADARKVAICPSLFDTLKHSKGYPLHHAISLRPPLQVVQCLLEAYPRAVALTESAYHRTALHLSCLCATSPQVTLEILQRDPSAANKTDALGRTPLHYALANRHPLSVQHGLLDLAPQACLVQDHRGWIPLHLAVSSGAPVRLVRRMIDVAPETLLIADCEGFVPRDFAQHFTGTREEVQEILDNETPIDIYHNGNDDGDDDGNDDDDGYTVATVSSFVSSLPSSCPPGGDVAVPDNSGSSGGDRNVTPRLRRDERPHLATAVSRPAETTDMSMSDIVVVVRRL